jgi:hypothetical protein
MWRLFATTSFRVFRTSLRMKDGVFEELPPGVGGRTLGSGDMLIEPRYAKECLTRDEFKNLYDIVLHESMHNTDGAWQRFKDRVYEVATGRLSQNHQSIYNRADFEMGRRHFGPPGEEVAIPTWPMWGIPFQPNIKRPIVAPLLDGLYDRTRSLSCEC